MMGPLVSRSHVVACVTLAGLLAASGAAAQSGASGQVEFGTFGTFNTYDNSSIGLDKQFGAGARLGFFLSPMFSVEANGDFTRADSLGSGIGVDVARIGGTVFAHLPVSSWNTVYLGAGYERLFYRGGMRGDDNGAHVIVGDKIPIGDRVALRLEGRAAYFPGSPFRAAGNPVLNLGGALGLSIYSFKRAYKDADRDKVADKRDICPGTPKGAVVDRNGCPEDGDGDRVFTGLDACPDTPRGATIDASGCPSDDDADRVFNGLDLCPNTQVGADVDVTGCPVDGDGDGVPAGVDQCADTPAGAKVDEQGCPLDADGDGVFDGLDQCNDSPAGLAVDATGCYGDRDGDGVADKDDECSGTAKGARVDLRGCEVGDSDGDGVTDNIDRCPRTTAGQNVDDIGCPVLFAVKDGERAPLVLKGVNFQSARSRLTRASHSVLDEVAASLLAHPQIRIEIAGHTDATGAAGPNLRLSQARARAVMAYLAQRGVDPSRMEARGYGETRPVATNRSKAGRALNRRVELNVTSGAVPPPARTPANAQPIPGAAETRRVVNDADRDGVADELDRCPRTTAGQSVDQVGCILLYVSRNGERHPLILTGFSFSSGQSALTISSFEVLDQVAASLLAHHTVRVEIGGHTDATGAARPNLRLSQARAEAVMEYLARLGVDPARMEARGYGETEPVASNRSRAGRAKNRRVELRIISQ